MERMNDKDRIHIIRMAQSFIWKIGIIKNNDSNLNLLLANDIVG